MLHCVQVGGGDRSGCPAQRTRRAARKPMRRTGPSMGRVAAPEQGGRPALPVRRAATDLRRRARRLPDPGPVNCLQKEHTA